MANLTDSDVVEVSQLVYHQWSSTMATLLVVKDEKDDGSLDWAEFHATRLTNAQAAEEKWRTIKTHFLADYCEEIDRAMGA